jgi:protein gp37
LGDSWRRKRTQAKTNDRDWVLDVQEQCKKADAAFFFKQWGRRNKKAAGRLLNGKTYDEMPEIEQQLSV